jgi:hypothetical protein
MKDEVRKRLEKRANELPPLTLAEAQLIAEEAGYVLLAGNSPSEPYSLWRKDALGHPAISSKLLRALALWMVEQAPKPSPTTKRKAARTKVRKSTRKGA